MSAGDQAEPTPHQAEPTPHGVTARPAVGHDTPDLARMHLAAVESLGAFPKGGPLANALSRGSVHADVAQGFAADLERGERSVVVGLLGVTVVGYGVLRPSVPVQAPAVIEELWVDPEAREVGVGSSLLDLLRDEADAAGSTAVDCVALPGDRNTKNFFEDHGMVARAITVSGPAQP